MYRSLVLVFTVVAVSAPAAAGAEEPTHAPLPPGLQALEQKMAALQLSTERVSGTVVLVDTSEGKGDFPAPKATHGKREARSHTLLAISTGTFRLSPLESTVRSRSNGKTSERRQVDGNEFVREPGLAAHDGGRPWVRARMKHSQSLEDDEGIFEGLGDGSKHFMQMVQALGDAEGLEEDAPTSVDGQSVEHFSASYAPGEYPINESAPNAHTLLKTLGKPSVKLEVFINSAGLPVRRSLTLSFSKLTETATLDVKEINIPLAAVKAPAPAKTIGVKAFVKLEVRLLRDELAKLKAHKHHS